MEHPFFPTTTTRAEALRWLTIAEKLLSKRDLMGSKSFATRARDADPTLTQADHILAVADTLLAGDMRIGNNQQDLYAILRLTPQQGRDTELVASQYRSLALLLNPQKNKFPFAEQAFRLVVESWSVLSNPSRKSMYDRELGFNFPPPPPQQIDQSENPKPTMHQNFNFLGEATSSGAAHQPPQSPPAAAVHYPKVSSQVDPLPGGSAREPKNFMEFTSGSNIVFGSGSRSGSKPSHEATFASNVTAAPPPGPTPSRVNEHEQRQENYSNIGNTANNVGENVEEEDEGIEVEDDEEEDVAEAPLNSDRSTFWTACPYCYNMYEYPGLYEDGVLRCQNCGSAFQGVAIPSPPPIKDGEEGYFCCWGFVPMGFSMENWEKNKASASTWTPFSPMFTCPWQSKGGSKGAKNPGPRKSSAPRIYVDDDDDDEVFVELSNSSSSDDDWNGKKRKKKGKTARRKSAKKSQVEKGKSVNTSASPLGVADTGGKPEGGESSKKGPAGNARKQPGRTVKNFGKLDLNVECSHEGEEAAATVPGATPGNGATRGEDENIEGNGFFEGLDEFLSSLPILSVVDDKVVKAT